MLTLLNSDIYKIKLKNTKIKKMQIEIINAIFTYSYQFIVKHQYIFQGERLTNIV